MINKINIENYEAFYLDYLEGNLGLDVVAELLLFLAAHPELEQELEGMGLITLSAEEDLKFDKDLLFKNINPTNIDEFIISDLEGQLNADDAKDLTLYLKKNPEAKVLSERYAKTIIPTSDLAYPEKQSLKREEAGTRKLIPWFAAAAAIALLISVFFGGLMDTTSSKDMAVQPTPEMVPEQQNEKLQNSSEEETENATVILEIPDRPKQEVVASAPTETMLKPSNVSDSEEKSQDLKAASVVNRMVIQKAEAKVTFDPSLQTNLQKENQAVVLADKGNSIEEEIVEGGGKKLETQVENEVIALADPLLPSSQKELEKELQKVDLKIDAQPELLAESLEEEVITTPDLIPEVERQETAKKSLRLNQWANKSIRKNILKEENPSTESVPGNELIAALTENIGERTATPVSYEHEKSKGRKTFKLSLGKLKISGVRHK